ncbi:MAG: diaminopimelate epimerase [Nannocystaceae bacterium]
MRTITAVSTQLFHKVEGTANDFVLIDTRSGPPGQSGGADGLIDGWSRRATSLCDRRRGIGADGILLVLPPRQADTDARMVVLNNDGSRPEMCGNGIRCVALYLGQAEARKRRFLVESDAGLRACTLLRCAGSRTDVRVNMGVAEVRGLEHPRAGAGRSFQSVSMGNAHAVSFVEPGEDLRQLALSLGPGVSRDRLYPRGANVEFARVGADGGLTVEVWERGAGLTRACGTGACAVVAAALHTRRVMAAVSVEVRLPGGVLKIDISPSDHGDVFMEGPARLVFSGTFPHEL